MRSADLTDNTAVTLLNEVPEDSRVVHYHMTDYGRGWRNARAEGECITQPRPLLHALPAKYVLNVLFLVADFQPSRCVKTYSRAVFHASDRNGVDLVSHSATITVH